MTPRMTVALTVLGLGLTVAALAGIPVFVENRATGDVLTVVGFAVAAVGIIFVMVAVPGQRRQNRLIERGMKVDVEQLKVERRALFRVKADVVVRLMDAKDFEERTRIERHLSGERLHARETLRLVELENGSVEDDIQRNTNEFARLGIDNPDATLNDRDL